MPIQRLNHAVLYVRDLERTKAFYTEALGFRVVNEIPGMRRLLPGPRLDQRPRPRHLRHRRPGRALAGRQDHRRAVPPRLGGRHARRAGAPGRRAVGARRARRRLRPRHHEVALRPRPGRQRVRGGLGGAARPARRRRRRTRRSGSCPSTSPASRPATAPTPSAASASRTRGSRRERRRTCGRHRQPGPADRAARRAVADDRPVPVLRPPRRRLPRRRRRDGPRRAHRRPRARHGLHRPGRLEHVPRPHRARLPQPPPPRLRDRHLRAPGPHRPLRLARRRRPLRAGRRAVAHRRPGHRPRRDVPAPRARRGRTRSSCSRSG